MMFLRSRSSGSYTNRSGASLRRSGPHHCLPSLHSCTSGRRRLSRRRPFCSGVKLYHQVKLYNQVMMRFALLWAAGSAMLYAADSRIDHVTIAGSELKQIQAKLAAVGIATVYGGAHSNHATEMALVSFPDGSYLELMGIQANADTQAVAGHVWAKFLKENAGPCAWAMREKDLAAEVSRLKAAGIAVSAPVGSGRTRPDGERLEWETSDVGAETRGTFFPFLIHDKTPREHRAFPQGKPVTKE